MSRQYALPNDVAVAAIVTVVIVAIIEVGISVTGTVIGVTTRVSVMTVSAIVGIARNRDSHPRKAALGAL